MPLSKEKMSEYYKQYRIDKKEVLQKKKKEWDISNKEKLIDYSLKRNYGISLDDYNAMLEQQEHKCYTCGIHNKEAPRGKLFVDHCHATGKVRKLLCSRCNTALGVVQENIDVLCNLISYLQEQTYEELKNETDI